MAQKILILGNSGTGKSTAIKELDPKQTFIIQCVNKRLPFRKSTEMYNLENKNLFKTTNIFNVVEMLNRINDNPSIKTLVIDDFNYLMTYGYKARAKEVGYAKFETLAFGVMDIFNKIDDMREDLTVFITAHTQKDNDGVISMKTIGKFLDEKLNIEGLFEIVILALGSDNNYNFTVNGLSPAKSPIGMFETDEVPNDLQKILETIKNYY